MRIAEAAVLLTIAVGAGIVTFRAARPDPPTPWQRIDGVPLRKWAEAVLDSSADRAGLSFSVHPTIVPLDARRLGDLRDSDGYHAFLHRCSSCHEPPDPMMHGAADWPWVVRRMAGWMEKTGALPMMPAESAAIIPFLQSAVTQSR